MKLGRIHRIAGAAAGAAVLAALLGIGATDARAAGGRGCDASVYALKVQALTGPGGAVLAIRITTASPTCAVPEKLVEVQATILGRSGQPERRLDVHDVASPAGTATVRLGHVARYRRVAVTVTFGPQITVRGTSRTLLRPDLVLGSVVAPRQILSGRPFNVAVKIGEPNRDVGATATVTVASAQIVLATARVRVRARHRVVVKLPVTLQAPGRTRLALAVTSDLPETTTANNTRQVAVDVTDFQIRPATVLVSSLAGYGGQFNHHVYAAISQTAGVTPDNVVVMEREMRALHPQFSRVFFSPSAFTDADRMQSFVRTVLLAQSTGTTINITWQGGKLDVPSGTVQKFADVLIDLVKNRGVTQLVWLTLQNEPNRTKLTPEQYEAQYRALDPYIQSIRGQVHYMGGDLVRGPDTGAPNQQVWFDYMATHMADILDAYSIHVFWDFWDTQKLQDRLTEVRAIVDALPESGRKPLYVTEYGVRGLRTLNGLPAGDPGVWTDGTPIAQTNVSAFQHAWFDVLSARLGYLGTSKWDSYFGMYDNAQQAYYMIGSPQNGWPLFPLYNFMQLVTTTVKRGWSVIGVDSVPETTRLLTAYVNAAGQRTIVGLDAAGAQLNTVSSTAVPYSIGGLPPSRKLRLVVWNQAGDGLDGPTTTVTTDAGGVASITVPQNGVFVLTTLRLA